MFTTKIPFSNKRQRSLNKNIKREFHLSSFFCPDGQLTNDYAYGCLSNGRISSASRNYLYLSIPSDDGYVYMADKIELGAITDNIYDVFAYDDIILTFDNNDRVRSIYYNSSTDQLEEKTDMGIILDSTTTRNYITKIDNHLILYKYKTTNQGDLYSYPVSTTGEVSGSDFSITDGSVLFDAGNFASLAVFDNLFYTNAGECYSFSPIDGFTPISNDYYSETGVTAEGVLRHKNLLIYRKDDEFQCYNTTPNGLGNLLDTLDLSSYGTAGDYFSDGEYVWVKFNQSYVCIYVYNSGSMIVLKELGFAAALNGAVNPRNVDKYFDYRLLPVYSDRRGDDEGAGFALVKDGSGTFSAPQLISQVIISDVPSSYGDKDYIIPDISPFGSYDENVIYYADGSKVYCTYLSNDSDSVLGTKTETVWVNNSPYVCVNYGNQFLYFRTNDRIKLLKINSDLSLTFLQNLNNSNFNSYNSPPVIYDSTKMYVPYGTGGIYFIDRNNVTGFMTANTNYDLVAGTCIGVWQIRNRLFALYLNGNYFFHTFNVAGGGALTLLDSLDLNTTTEPSCVQVVTNSADDDHIIYFDLSNDSMYSIGVDGSGGFNPRMNNKGLTVEDIRHARYMKNNKILLTDDVPSITTFVTSIDSSGRLSHPNNFFLINTVKSKMIGDNILYMINRNLKLVKFRNI
jgi:hypothetical protein